MDSMVTENSHMDGWPDFAPSHWKENFKIFYLTEKMRCLADPYFAELSDRIQRNKLLEEDIKFLKSRIVECPSESFNESFKSGKLVIVVTTNAKKDLINNENFKNFYQTKKSSTAIALTES